MRILIDFSFHGYGHVAQAIPVVRALKRRIPSVEITVRCAAPEDFIRSRLLFEFDYLREEFDFGMVMKNAVEVDVAASRQRFIDFHCDWEKRIEFEADKIRRIEPGLLLADVPYLSLAAAAAAGIPAVVFCSLNWADIYRHYCGTFPEAARIHRQILAAYNCAQAFCIVEPGMPMPGIERIKRVGPVAALGRNSRAEIERKFGLESTEALGLLSMGGMAYPVNYDSWPEFRRVRWLASGASGRVLDMNTLNMPFQDILASVDFLLTKPGYGSFTEAACLGLPVLYLARPDWPEAPYLVSWLQSHGNCLRVSPDEFRSGHFENKIDTLLAMPQKQAVASTGAEEIVDFLASFL